VLVIGHTKLNGKRNKIMGLASFLARQGRKAKKLSTKATEGQEKIEPVTREQRAYAKGQVKAAAATALTAAVIGKMSLSEMKERLKNETDEKNKERLKNGINKALMEAQEGSRTTPQLRPKARPKTKEMLRPKARPTKMSRGGLTATGNNDMRKGGMFYKGGVM